MELILIECKFFVSALNYLYLLLVGIEGAKTFSMEFTLITFLFCKHCYLFFFFELMTEVCVSLSALIIFVV